MDKIWRMRPRTYRAIVDLSEFAMPREFCGLLERPPGSEDYLILRPMRNVAEAENEYLVDMDQHLEAIAAGADVKGVVHSHVKTSIELSSFDKDMAAPGFLYAVYSIRDGELGCWMLGNRKSDHGEWRPIGIMVDNSI